MLDVIRQIFELTIFSSADQANIICISQSVSTTSTDKPISGEHHLPAEIFPEFCQIHPLAADEAFLDDIQTLILQKKPQRILLIPPFINARNLSKPLQQKFPRWSLHNIALRTAVALLSPGTHLGAILPEGFCIDNSDSSTREYLLQNANVEFLISSDNSHCIFPGVHSFFKFCILTLRTGQPNQAPIKFFRLPKQSAGEKSNEVIKDLQKLIKQGGGKTKYGYVYRELIEPGKKLFYDTYHPDLLQRQKQIGEYGSIKRLGDIFEIRLGRVNISDTSTKLFTWDSQGIPLIDGRAILSDGSLEYRNTNFKVSEQTAGLLEAGDICLRSIVGSDIRLKFAEIFSDMLPLAASNHVVILRLNSEINPEDRELILAYLGSEFAMEWLRAQGMSVHLYPSLLAELPVPFFDEDLRNAVRSLTNAARQFDSWRIAAEEARSSLFKSNSAKDSRLFLLTVGRTARQRQEAARLIDDFDYRARTRLPHPIAYRWRTVKSSYKNLDGYREILECAEISVCYLAHIAIILARYKNIPIKYITEEMSKRLRRKKYGTTFGDWVSILCEVRDSKEFCALEGHIPFYEILKFLEPGADSALKKLLERRNDNSHSRGPKGVALTKAFEEALEELELLLKSAEFISEYPLYYIEQTRRDSIRKITSYSYRNLMGDHPLVPIQSNQTDESEIEAGSLYIVDRDGKLYLLRPLLTRIQCPKCGTLETFYLDSYTKDGDTTLKSMEQGHITKDKEVASILKESGIFFK